MATAILGYFTTMVTALLGLMFLLNSALSSSFLQHTRQRPYATPIVAEAVLPDVPEKKPVNEASTLGNEVASIGTPKRVEISKPVFVEKKTARAKVASAQRRREDSAGREQDRQYSMALGYAQEAPRQSVGLFDMFGTRRF